MLEQRNDLNKVLNQEIIEKMNLYDRFSLWCFHYFHPNCCRIKIDDNKKNTNSDDFDSFHCFDCFDCFDCFCFDYCMFCNGSCCLA